MPGRVEMTKDKTTYQYPSGAVFFHWLKGIQRLFIGPFIQ